MIENNSAFVYRQPLGKTFVTAFSGIKYFFKTERNGKIQACIALFMLLAGFYFKLSATEWIFILLSISAVIGLEIMNSALEHLCNLVHKEYNPVIKHIKDVAAGAVLFASIISVAIGLIIFLPKIIALL